MCKTHGQNLFPAAHFPSLRLSFRRPIHGHTTIRAELLPKPSSTTHSTTRRFSHPKEDRLRQMSLKFRI